MERRTLELPAGVVDFRETGPADGPVVGFVHGFLVDDLLWADVPERLGERGFHCFAPTWPLGAHPGGPCARGRRPVPTRRGAG